MKLQVEVRFRKIREVFVSRKVVCAAVFALACLLANRAARGQMQIAMPIPVQFQQGGGGSIVGDWHQVQQTPDGGTVHTYWIFGQDGSFKETSVQVGGKANGTRTQVWGHYQASPANNGSLFVKTVLTGRAPLKLCMEGLGCRPTPTPAGTLQGYFQVRGNTFETSGITAHRDKVPQELLTQLPAVWNLQPPPPLPSPTPRPGPNPGPSGGAGPKCDNLQQERICTVNDGHIWIDNYGCHHCVAPY